MIPAPVRYVRAKSLADVFGALADPDAKVLAGGQSLLPVLKLRIVRPSVLVDVSAALPRGVERADGEIRVGALTTWDELARSPDLEEPGLAALAECAQEIGDLQVRNRGTVGGSLAHADPASDFPAVALALGAQVLLRSEKGDRVVPASEFFVGPFLTALAPGELIVEVRFPVPSLGSGSAYAKVEHPASGFALAGAAALVRAEGPASVAVTGVGAHPFALPEGDPLEALADADIYGDERFPAEYRRHLAGVVAGRALDQATRRSQESR
jgi:aerobic carbon-monoxide dehydrogenase medium subunit